MAGLGHRGHPGSTHRGTFPLEPLLAVWEEGGRREGREEGGGREGGREGSREGGRGARGARGNVHIYICDKLYNFISGYIQKLAVITKLQLF